MSFFSWCQIVRFIMLVPNCPGAKLSGAKLSVFIMLVPNCPGAKLSGAKLSWCQIVLVPNCPVPNCPVPNCPTTLAGHRGMTPSKGGTMARIARRKTNKQNLVALVFAVSFGSLWPGEWRLTSAHFPFPRTPGTLQIFQLLKGKLPSSASICGFRFFLRELI